MTAMQRWGERCHRHAVAVIAITAALSLGLGLFAFLYLGITPSEDDFTERRGQPKSTAGDVIVVVNGPNAAHNQAAVDATAAAMRQDPASFSLVIERVDLDVVRNRLLLYLPLDALERGRAQLDNLTPWADRILARPGLVSLFAAIDDELRAAVQNAAKRAMQGQGPSAQGGERLKQLENVLPILRRLIAGMRRSLNGEADSTSPLLRLVAGRRGSASAAFQMPHGLTFPLPQWYYPCYDGGRTYVVLVSPRADPSSRDAGAVGLGAVRAVLDRVQPAFPDVEFGITGPAAIANDQLRMTLRDGRIGLMVSACGLILLFAVVFRSAAQPLLLLASLLLALVQTLGWITLLSGHLNAYSLYVIPIVLAAGLDFGMQIAVSHAEQLRLGGSPQEVLGRTMRGSGTSVLLAGAIGGAAFLAASISNFVGFRDLALMLGIGLLVTVEIMLGLYAAALSRAAARSSREAAAPSAPPWRMEQPATVVVVAAILSMLAANAARKVTFDANPWHLANTNDASMRWAARLIEEGASGVLSIDIAARDVAQARVLEAHLQAIPAVGQVMSALPMIPQDETEKLPVARAIQAWVGALPRVRAPQDSIDVDRLKAVLSDLRKQLLIVYPEAYDSGGQASASTVSDFILSVDRLVHQTASLDAAVVRTRLSDYERRLFGDLGGVLDLVRGSKPIEPFSAEELPDWIRAWFFTPQGEVLLHVYPREKSFRIEPLRQFVGALRSFGGRPQGTAMQLLMLDRPLRNAISRAASVALGVAAILLLLCFRASALLVALPCCLCPLWVGGVLGAARGTLTPVSFLVFPILMAVCLANGIHVYRRFQDDRRTHPLHLGTGRAILISNLSIAICGFALIPLRVVGLRDLGYLLALGAAVAAVTSLIVLPALLEVLSARRPTAS